MKKKTILISALCVLALVTGVFASDGRDERIAELREQIAVLQAELDALLEEEALEEEAEDVILIEDGEEEEEGPVMSIEEEDGEEVIIGEEEGPNLEEIEPDDLEAGMEIEEPGMEIEEPAMVETQIVEEILEEETLTQETREEFLEVESQGEETTLAEEVSEGTTEDVMVLGSEETTEESMEILEEGPKIMNGIEIVHDFTLKDITGTYTRRFLVLKNGTEETLNIKTKSVAYDEAGEILAEGAAEVAALGAGCTTLACETYKISDPISSFDMEVETKTPLAYKSVIEYLSYEMTPIDRGTSVAVTNMGEFPAQFVEVYALFMKGGELVDYSQAYYTDEQSELKSGATLSKEFTSFETYDEIQIYLAGRRVEQIQ